MLTSTFVYMYSRANKPFKDTKNMKGKRYSFVNSENGSRIIMFIMYYVVKKTKQKQEARSAV